MFFFPNVINVILLLLLFFSFKIKRETVLPGPLKVFGPKDQKIRPNERKIGPYLEKRGLLILLPICQKKYFSLIFARHHLILNNNDVDHNIL